MANILCRKLRYLQSREYDRLVDLIAMLNTDVDTILSGNEHIVKQLSLIEITKDAKKYKELLAKIETLLLKNSKYNMVIHNIPLEACEKYTNQTARITYKHIRDTLSEFGEIDQLEIIRGSVYTNFKNNDERCATYQLINNMQMGNNILNVVIV